MSDSVEHRVTCFEIAQNRMAQNKPTWDFTVNLREIVDRHGDEEPTDAQLIQICRDIMAELRAKLPVTLFDMTLPGADYEFLELVEYFEKIQEAELAMYRKNGDTPADMIDDYLSELYTWCDLNRVWTSG